MPSKRIPVKQRVMEIMYDLYVANLGSIEENKMKKLIRSKMRHRKITPGSIKNYISAMRELHYGYWTDCHPYRDVKGLLVRGKRPGELAISVKKARSVFKHF